MMLSSSAVDRAVAGLSPWLRTGSTPFDTTAEKSAGVLAPAPPDAAPGLDSGQDGGEGQRGQRQGGEERAWHADPQVLTIPRDDRARAADSIVPRDTDLAIMRGRYR